MPDAEPAVVGVIWRTQSGLASPSGQAGACSSAQLDEEAKDRGMGRTGGVKWAKKGDNGEGGTVGALIISCCGKGTCRIIGMYR